MRNYIDEAERELLEFWKEFLESEESNLQFRQGKNKEYLKNVGDLFKTINHIQNQSDIDNTVMILSQKKDFFINKITRAIETDFKKNPIIQVPEFNSEKVLTALWRKFRSEFGFEKLNINQSSQKNQEKALQKQEDSLQNSLHPQNLLTVDNIDSIIKGQTTYSSNLSCVEKSTDRSKSKLQESIVKQNSGMRNQSGSKSHKGGTEKRFSSRKFNQKVAKIIEKKQQNQQGYKSIQSIQDVMNQIDKNDFDSIIFKQNHLNVQANDLENYISSNNKRTNFESRRDSSKENQDGIYQNPNSSKEIPHTDTNSIYKNQEEQQKTFDSGYVSPSDLQQSNSKHTPLNSQIFCIGGISEENAMFIESYDDQNIENCRNFGDFYHSDFTDYSTVQINQSLLLIGGKISEKTLDICLQYDILNNKWEQSAIKLNIPKANLASCYSNNILYLSGGRDFQDEVLQDYEAINIQTLEKQTAKLQCKRADFSMIVSKQNEIFVFGGFGGNNNTENSPFLSSCEKLDHSAKEWKFIANMNCKRAGLSVVEIQNQLYAFGGFDGKSYLASVEIYDQSNNNWQFFNPMNEAKAFATVVKNKDENSILVLGGFNSKPLTNVEKFDFNSGQWELQKPLKSKRFKHFAITFDQNYNNS